MVMATVVDHNGVELVYWAAERLMPCDTSQLPSSDVEPTSLMVSP
jgi:hypothetical protein